MLVLSCVLWSSEALLAGEYQQRGQAVLLGDVGRANVYQVSC